MTTTSRRRPSKFHVAGSAVALLMLAPLLTSCNGAGANATQPQSSAKDSASASVTEISVFTAQSMVDVLPKLITAYQDQHPGVRINASFGGSGTLATQINQGAQADIFIAADTTASKKITVPLDSIKVFASNKLVLVVPTSNPGKVSGLDDLPKVQVALCAASVPCGRSTATLLKDQHLTLEKPSEETDVRSVLAKVSNGQADAGFVYATDALAAGDKVKVIPLTATINGAKTAVKAPINEYQYSAISKGSKHADSVKFLEWLSGEQAQSILAAAGFSRP